MNNNKQILFFLGGILFFLTSLGWIGISHGAKEIRKSPTARLVKIDSQDLKDRWRVIIETSQPVLFTKKILSSPHGLVVDLTPCVLDKSQPFTFNINAPWFEGFKYFQFNQKTVRIVFNFSQASDPLISPMEGKPYQLFINFPKIQAQSTQPIPPKEEEETLPPKNVEEFKKEKAILDSEFKKKQAESQKPRVTFDFYMTNLHNVIRLIADVGGINVVFPEDIKDKERKVTLSLREVPWDEALDSILDANNLKKISRGEKTFLIITSENYKKLKDDEIKTKQEVLFNLELEEVTKRKEERLQKGEKNILREKVFTLKNVGISEVIDSLKMADYKMYFSGLRTTETSGIRTSASQAGLGVTSGGGTVGASGVGTNQSTTTSSGPSLFLIEIKHTNSIFVRGNEQEINIIEKLIDAIDRPISQVMIEARIVEADANFTRDLGIRWGGTFPFSNASGPFAGTIRGGDAGATSTNPTNNYAVNLPFTTAVPAFGGLGLSFASTNFNLDVRLQAMEQAGRGKTLSSPKILTLDNKPAVIKQGKSIPVTTRTENNTFSTTYKDAALTLEVTPHISSGKKMHIELKITKNEPDFRYTDSLGNPTITTKEAKTEMMIDDGNTVVLGGIMYKKESSSENRIPGLADIPFLGWLFKTRYRSTEDTEMLIFITPKILKSTLSERFNEDKN